MFNYELFRLISSWWVSKLRMFVQIHIFMKLIQKLNLGGILFYLLNIINRTVFWIFHIFFLSSVRSDQDF